MDNFSPGVGAEITQTMDERTRYQVRSGFALREVLGEYLTIPVSLPPNEPSRMAVLNEEGKFLWELLKSPRRLDELIAAMTENYDVSPDEARTDILEFLQEMDQNALLVKKSEVAP